MLTAHCLRLSSLTVRTAALPHFSLHRRCATTTFRTMQVTACAARDAVSQTSQWKPHRLALEIDPGDWVEQLDMSSACAFGATYALPPKILVLYGSLRSRSYSRLLALEFARILEKLGAEVRIYDPRDLPSRARAVYMAAVWPAGPLPIMQTFVVSFWSTIIAMSVEQ